MQESPTLTLLTPFYIPYLGSASVREVQYVSHNNSCCSSLANLIKPILYLRRAKSRISGVGILPKWSRARLPWWLVSATSRMLLLPMPPPLAGSTTAQTRILWSYTTFNKFCPRATSLWPVRAILPPATVAASHRIHLEKDASSKMWGSLFPSLVPPHNTLVVAARVDNWRWSGRKTHVISFIFVLSLTFYFEPKNTRQFCVSLDI